MSEVNGVLPVGIDMETLEGLTVEEQARLVQAIEFVATCIRRFFGKEQGVSCTRVFPEGRCLTVCPPHHTRDTTDETQFGGELPSYTSTRTRRPRDPWENSDFRLGHIKDFKTYRGVLLSQ